MGPLSIQWVRAGNLTVFEILAIQFIGIAYGACIYVGEDNDFNVQAMIIWLMWTIWTSLSAVRERLLNLIDLRTAQVYCDWIILVSQEVSLNFHHFCG